MPTMGIMLDTQMLGVARRETSAPRYGALGPSMVHTFYFKEENYASLQGMLLR